MIKHIFLRLSELFALRGFVPLALGVAFLSPTAFLTASHAIAAPAIPIAPSACDPDYYSSMSSRAWLEAQREITQNQNLIFKPDSVLEYTCFDQFLNVLAAEAPNMFSKGDMPAALTNLVSAALTPYINNNFNHNYLGGRDPVAPVPMAAAAAAGAYNCSVMNDVWEEAKCINFASDAANDGFYSFADYQADPDKRFLPAVCPGIPVRWQNEIDLAFDELTTPWIEDNVTTFYDQLDPAGCSGLTPIPTGVTVHRPRQIPNEFEEHICLAPGCYYVPTGMAAGDCKLTP